MNLQFPNENNNIKFEDNYSSYKKDINKNLQNEYLANYHKIYGESFNDVELLDIFEKNNYNDGKIKNYINSLLLMENNRNFDKDNNSERHYSPQFAHNIQSKTKQFQYDKNDKIFFQKDSEIPSDYGAPPKNEENNDQDINNKILLEYKKNLFNKLRSTNNTYKIKRNINEELNFEEIIQDKTELIINKNTKIENELNEIDKNNDNYNNINDSPNFKAETIKKKPIDNINKNQKKEYIKIFFGNMKKYSKKPINKRDNLGKSPNFGKRKNILDMSPNKADLYDKKVLTYKKGLRNNFSKNKKTYNYKYLKINKKVNDIFISAYYDNPQREQFLKIFNEKRKENPNKLIELIIPQIPTIPSVPFYSNVYPPYNQFNPYMNMYMIPAPIQYQSQNVLNSQMINNKQFNNSQNNMLTPINNSQNMQNTNNMLEPINNSLNINSLNTDILQLYNNQINQLNNNSNGNSFLINNIGMQNYSNKKSSGNVSTRPSKP